jgi:DNA processing protein
MALGIDGAAHQAALDSNKTTIAVLGSGIDRAYPIQHKYLYENIKKNGLVISEFPLNTAPAPRQFPRRNRIISGLSLGVLVVEAAVKSGSLNTARWALEQNRAVMAVPGGVNQPNSTGCNFLIQQGACLVTSVADILAEINYHVKDNNNHCDIVSLVKQGINTLDEICNKLHLSLEDAIARILDLELAGKLVTNAGFYKCT